MNHVHSSSFDFDDLISLYFIFEEIDCHIKEIGNKAHACRQIQHKYNIPGSVQSLVKRYDRYIHAGRKFDNRQLFNAYEEMTFTFLL